MRKISAIIIAIILGWSSIFAQKTIIDYASKTDTTASIPCVFNYFLTYDSLMLIPDGPNCAGMSDCYNSSVTYNIFSPGEEITSASDIRSICMNIEHSFLGDLQFRLVCPNGSGIMLHSQPNGGGLYLGVPIDDTGGCETTSALTGEGWTYCWSDNPEYSYHGAAPNFLHLNQTGRCDSTSIIGDSNYYHPMNSFAGLIGCPLNGTWSLEICDLYGIDDGWIWNWSMNLKNMDTLVTGGVVFFDHNQNCQRDVDEFALPQHLGLIEPSGIYVQTNSSGVWQIDSLPAGDYTITMDTTNSWVNSCGTSQSFTIIDGQATIVPCIGLYNPITCTFPYVNIYTPVLRPCFSNQHIYVMAQNLNMATSILDSVYVNVQLDSLLQVTGSSSPYEILAPNTYRFYIDSLSPGEPRFIDIITTLSCNAMLGQSICMRAEISPIASCNIDSVTTPVFPDGVTPCTLPWDHSSLSVIGWCANDSVHFRITNTGSPENGNMQCYSPVRVYIDGTLTYFDSIMLAGGQSVDYSYPGNGQTWILQTDQHPLHPGNSHPNAHVEACGNINNWTPGLVNDFPLDDLPPIIDQFCREVTGSFDPNIKVGYPYGVGDLNIIAPNQPIQYAINFQNTGTDTAFTVVLRDTLDVNLNIFSVIPDIASHPYTFRIYGPRILEWTFSNILLPDSSINEAASKGFATFTINQNPNLAKGTRIYNKADIYFDYNPPITTNETSHTIGIVQSTLPTGIDTFKNQNKSIIHVYPNPATNQITVIAPYEIIGETYTLINFLGQGVGTGKITQLESKINLSGLSKGVYLLKIGNSNNSSYKIIKN